MLAPVEDVYTAYLQHLYLDADLDEDVVESTLRQLGHTTPSIRSMLGRENSTTDSRQRRRPHGGFTSSSESSWATPAAAASAASAGSASGNTPLAGAGVALETAARQTPASHEGSTVAALTRESAIAAQPASEGPSVSVAEAYAMLQRLRADLHDTASDGAAAAAAATTVPVARALLPPLSRPLPLSAEDCTGERQTNAEAPDAKESRDLMSSSSNSGGGALTDLTPSLSSHSSGVAVDDPPRDSTVVPVAHYIDSRARSANHQRLRTAASPASNRGSPHAAGVVGHSVRPRTLRAAFIPGARACAVPQTARFSSRDSVPADAELRGRPIGREPVGSRVVREGSRGGCGAVRGGRGATQMTSAAAPNVRSVAMRQPTTTELPSRSQPMSLPSTLPRALRTDTVRRAQEYLRYWTTSEQLSSSAARRAMWATRYAMLAGTEGDAPWYL